jgi:hypothetical protein
MDPEWIVGLVVTLLLGLGGIAGTLFAGFRQTDTAIRVAKLSIDGQLAGAREERQQRRLEAAYTELLIRLTVVRDWANAVYPMWTSTAGEYTMPPLPPASDKERTEAIVTATWSPRVQELMHRWDTVVGKIKRTGETITLGLRAESTGRESSLDSADHLARLPELRQELNRADRAIRQQVSRELRGEDDGHIRPEGHNLT